MVKKRRHRSWILREGTLMVGVMLAGGLLAAPGIAAEKAAARKTHASPPARQGGTVVTLCDGETSVEVPGLKPGETMNRQQAQSVSSQLMTEWRKKNPNAHWDEVLAQAAPAPSTQGRPLPATTSPTPAQTAPQQGRPAPAVQGESRQAGVYENYTSRDELIWAAETQKFVELGNKVFHSDKELGGTIGVSCDMCHPNAANTHPETYPKYQVQLQKVALLRDMINWCIENPVKGHPLADDDPRLRAIEAYILAQRKGVKLDYGKH